MDTVDHISNFQQFFNWVPIASLILDEQGIIQKANHEACQYLPDLAKTGQNLIHHLPVEEHSKYLQFITELRQPEATNKLKIQFNRHEHPTLLNAISYLTTDKQIQINLTLNPAETQKKRLPNKHETSKDLVGIIIFNAKCNIEYANTSIKDLFGYDPSELYQQSITKLVSSPNSKIHPDFVHYFKHKAGNILGINLELTGKHKDNSVILLNFNVEKYNADPKKCYIATVQLISDHKSKSQPDKERLDALAHVTRVGLMAEMASGIAHEVNQPLTAISAYTQACLRIIKQPDFSCEKLTETLEKIHKQVLKAGQIIHRMRDFSKSRKMSRSSIDINRLILDALEFCEPDCRQFNVQQKTELAKSLPLIFVDPIHIEQVILNLVRNSIEALKNMPDQHIKTLTIETYLNDKDQIEVRVKDNGPGLNPAEQSKVLNPFYTTKKSGMGMGLSISRSIIEAHDGVLRFNSQKTKGTTCYFTLPVYEEINDIR